MRSVMKPRSRFLLVENAVGTRSITSVLKSSSACPRLTSAIWGIFLAIFLAACQTSTPTTPTVTSPPVIVKQLATLAPTSTLNAAEIQATQAAIEAMPTQLPPTTIPTETPYVGVFIGEAEVDLLNPPIIPSPLPVAQATPVTLETCSDEITTDAVFGTNWTAEARLLGDLGCPIQVSFGFTGTIQVMENGVMYHRTDTGEVWAIAPGTLTTNGEYWYVAEAAPVVPQGIVPPPGMFLPEGVIGAVWLTTIEARGILGFAVTREQEASINLQRFEGGTLFLDVNAGQVFVLLVNGTAFGPY